jgi:hypothetical protein
MKITTLALGACLPLAASAAITEFKVMSTEPYGEFATGKFVRIEAEARGELSPAEAIPGLDKAPRNARGLVEYRTPVTLIVPESPRSGNGNLLVDVPNRGRPIAHGLYNSPRARPIAVGSFDQGTGFLQNRGWSVAAVQWEQGEGPVFPAFDDGKGGKLFAEGVGFAAVRDVTLFLRDARAGNPLAGTIERTFAVGYSQTGRLLKSFLLNGFNQYDDRMVFDGLHIAQAAAGQLPLLAAGPGPGSVAAETPSHLAPELRGVHEEPFTYGDAMKAVGAKYRKLPRVLVSHSYNDYLGGRAALTRTGARGTVDLPLPDNVRMFDISGSPHINGRAKIAECGEGPGQIDWAPAVRAQLVALDEWVRGKAPPPSRLFELEARPGDREVFQAPRYLAGAVVMVPKRDRDGNAMSGVVLPDIAVPIASHGYMNTPLTVQACRQAGTYRPFAKTAAERQAGDERVALDARYPGGINEYLTKIRAATRALVADRLLLDEDAAVIVNAAAENSAFAPTRPRVRGATTAR